MSFLEAIRSRFSSPKAPQFFLGAFGKHPGWDDHLDDLGLETDALLAAKHFIYNQGIGGVLDSGQWEALGEDALTDFNHLFVWLSDDEMLAGRMWSSSDGKGRKRYPMNLCGQINRGGGTDRLTWISGLLSQWEMDCRGTDQASEVRQIVSDGRAFVTLALSSSSDHLNPPFSRKAFAEKAGLAPDGEAIARVAYAAESYLAPFAPSNAEAAKLALGLKLAQSRLVPQHFRLRADPASPVESIVFWNDFFAPMMAEAAPRLFVIPVGEAWVDLIIGLPTAKHLGCIKARPRAVALTSDIPFGLSAEHQARAEKQFRQFLGERETEPTLQA